MDGFIMENPAKMDALEGKPTIFGTIHIKPSRFFGDFSKFESDSVSIWKFVPFYQIFWCPKGPDLLLFEIGTNLEAFLGYRYIYTQWFRP